MFNQAHTVFRIREAVETRIDNCRRIICVVAVEYVVIIGSCIGFPYRACFVEEEIIVHFDGSALGRKFVTAIALAEANGSEHRRLSVASIEHVVLDIHSR